MYKPPASQCHRQLAHFASLYHAVRAIYGKRNWASWLRIPHATTAPQRLTSFNKHLQNLSLEMAVCFKGTIFGVYDLICKYTPTTISRSSQGVHIAIKRKDTQVTTREHWSYVQWSRHYHTLINSHFTNDHVI